VAALSPVIAFFFTRHRTPAALRRLLMKAPPVVALLTTLLLLSPSAVAQSNEALVSRIKRIPVQSTNVASVGYSRQLQALEIEFTRGAIYRFLNVPPSVHRELLAAESKGHFIAEHIRGQYVFVRVRASRPAKSELVRPSS
jgi:KTSC domain